MASLGLIALLVCIAVFVKSLLLIGIIATIANCLMFAAPLAVMQQVIRTKSVRYMPFLLSLASFLCALVWLVWAILSVDYFVLIPNALGSLFGLVQLVIYGVYWRMQRLRDNEETQRLRDPESDVSSEDCPPLSAK
jgi:solute carrier family 50 protein (sugar transporter)